MRFDRYVLLQAKKYLIGEGSFAETNRGNKHLTIQVGKMHSFNPEFSYLLLYSTTESPAGNKVAYSTLYEEGNWRFHPFLVETFAPGKQFPIISVKGNFPITVIRASTWEAMHRVSPEILLNYGSCLPDFILNDLVAGKVGKTWDEDIEKAEGQFSVVVTLSIGQG